MNPVEPGSVVKSTSQDNLISTPSDQELISLAEAAKLTPYSQEYISLLARRGKLLAWKKGRNWCTTREAVQSYLDKQTKDAAEKLERHQVVLESSKPEIKEVKPGIILSPEQLLPVAEIKVATPIVSEIKVSPEIKPEVPVVIPVEKVATAESSAVLAAREIANVLGETLGARFDSIKQELKQVNEQVSRSVPAYATPVPSAVVVKQNKIKSHWFYLALFLIAVPVIIFSLTQGLAEDAPGKLLASLKNAWTLDGHRAGTEANEVLILNEAGNISIKGHIETQGQLRSYARDGIAPIVVDSTTKIEKLNADAIDGYSSEQFNLAFITKQGNVTSDDVYLKGKVEVGQILEVKGATKLLDELLVGGGLGVWGKSFFHNDVAVDGKVDVSKSLAVKKDITAGGNVVAQNKVVAEKGLETGGDIVTNNNDIFLGSGTIIKEGKELIKNLNAEYWNGQAASDFNLDMITDNGAVTDNQITVGGINSTGTSRFTGRTELLGETVIGNLESLTVNGKTNLRNTDVSGTLAVAGHGLFSSLGVAGSAGVINLSSKEFSTTNASIGGSSSNTLAVAASSTFSGPISASNSVSLTSATPAISTSAGDLVLQSKGATTTANVQIGVGGDGSTTPDLLVLDVKSDATDPTGTDGAMYYNTSTDKFRCYENAAWTDCVGAGGGGGSTLQAAYVSGNTISTTTDDGDLAVTLADTTTDRNFTVTIADGATGTVSISRADGAGTSDPSQLLLLDNLDTNRSIADGLKIQSAAGLIVDGIDVSDAELTNALNVGDNIIAGTTAEINFSNFDLATSGNIQVAAGVGLDTNGAGSLTLGVSNATTIDIAGGSSSTGCTITNATGSLVCSGINSTPVGATSPSTGAFTTLSSTGATTLGNNSSTVAVDTTSWDISSAGAISGLTGLTVASGTVSLPNGQIDNSELANSTITFAGDTGSSTTALGATRTIAGGGGLTSADNSSGTLTLAVGAGTGITVNADDLAVNQSTAFAWTGQQSWTATVTATGALGDFNPTLGNDTDVDTVAGIQIDATSAATGDADNFYGLNITLASADATVNERAIEIGSGWDSALSVGGSSIINGSGVLQSAGLSGTYSNALTLSSATNSITAGTLIVGADTVTDLTGTGLQVVANALQATLGTDITSSEIADDSIMNVDINSAAAIAFSKLAALTSGNILVGNGSNVATSVAMSGDVLISNAGLTTIQPDAVVLATDTSGSYIATIAGSTQVGVSGSGLENAAVSLSINNDSIGDTQLAFDTGQTLTTTATPQFARLGVGVAADATNILTATSTSTTDLSKVLNISHTGAITGTGYASYFSKTGASTTNVGLYSTASGASNNYAAVFEAGNVGIGDTTPSSKLEIGDGTDSLQISTVGDLTFVDADGAASITGPAGGALTIASGASQALTLTGNAASIWDIGANVLSLQTTNNGAITTGTGLLTSGGNITFSGTSARTITGPNTGAAAALTLTTTGNGSGLKLTSAAGASGNSGAITLQSGDTATSGTSGAITIDSGAGVTANGVITIGTTNAPTTTIGGCTFDRVAGSMSCSGAVGGGTGTQGYWNRSGTTLSPATAGDSVSTSGAISTTGTGAVTSAGTLTASADFTANGNVQLGDNTADTLTIYPTAWTATPTISGLITATSGITSNGTATFNTNTNFTLAGAENVSLTNTTASADQLSLAVSGVTTDAVDGLAIAFTQADDADAADTNAALNISLTSSSTDADTLYGINLSNITAGTANEYAINIGTGYDRGINLGANSIVGSTGIIDYTNFDVDASGNVTVAGDLAVNGGNVNFGATTTIGDGGDALTIDSNGTLTISDATVTGSGALTVTPAAASALTLGTTGVGNTTSITLATDSTGDAEVVLPTGSVSGTEILDDTVVLTTDTAGDYVASITAGGGLTGTTSGEGSTPTLAVGAGTGITVNADDVAINQDTSFTWTNSHAFTLAGAENVSLTNTTASADQLSLAVSGVTTDAVDGLAIAFTQADDADAADTNAALNISLTSSSTDADTLYGINLSNITAGTANEYAINIGTGYDRGINLGANSIVGSTGIIDYTNFDVDASGNVDALGTLTAGSANEVLTLSTGKIDADAITLAASGTTGSTSSRSGLQTSSDGLTLLMGCADGQLLEWTDASGWACAADDTGSSGASVEEGDSAAVAALSVLDFLAADFVVSESPANEANVSIDYPNSGITRKAQAETISGGWTFNTAATTFTTAINANGGITTTTADQNLAFSANGGGDFVFNVDSGTFVSITGTADGESALTIAAGNLTLTDGDLAVSAGDFNVNLDDGDTVNIDGDATPTADLLKLGNGDTSATDDVDALQITFATSGASGNLIDLSPTFADSDAGNSAETWNAVNVNAFTVTQNDSGGAITGVVNGFNLGNLTESPTGDDAITSTAIKLGTGWDYIFDTAGFDVLGATGATTITGSGDGTDALTLTAGDILVTNGDLDLSGGDFNVILDAGDGVNITKGAAPTVDVFSINGSTSTTDGVDGLQLTFGVSAASGNVIDITPSYTDATAGATSETYNIIDVDAFTATQNATGDTGLINGLAIGALTQTETAGALTAYALNIGSGWDSVLRVNGTEVVDASGNVPVARINGTLFTVQGDNAAGRAITQGNTLTIAGGTNLTSVDADTDTVTINLDDSITLAGDLTVQGQNVNFDNATDIDIDDNTASSFTISEGANNYFLITTTNDSEVVTLNLPAGGATSLTGNLFTSDIVKTINIGTGTAADTINLGTGTTNPDAINIGTTDTVAHVIRIGDNTGASSSDIAIADAQWSITTAGLITTADNLAVNGGDITTTATDPNIFNTGTISTIDIGATVTGNITFSNGSGSSGCTIDGSGNLACAGTITGSTSGAQGYWTRTSTTLSPTNAGDSIDMPSGTGVFTQTYAPAGTTVAATGATFIPTFGVHADNQTLVGVAINPVTNSNDDTGDILNALSIGTINATLASERAIYIGTSYDTDLVFGDTTPVVTFGDGGNLTFTDGTNTLLTLTDGGTVGNLSVSGDVTTTGDVAINGGNLNFGAATTIGDGGDTIAFSLKDNSADALDVQQSTNNYININTSDGNENIALSTLRQTGGDAISLLGDSITTGTAVGVSADVITTGVALDISSISTVASSADLIQVDHTATYVTTVANSGNLLDLSRALTTNTGGALTNSGAVATITSNCTQTAGTCTDTANILSLTQSYASASGAVIKTSNAGTGVDIELDNAETIDNSVNGTINLGTTTFKLTGGTTIVSDQATVALLDSTTTTINFGSAATAVNLADAAITGTIDIGGVTADGASTINIATNSTSSDTLVIGNSNASTLVTLTGGDDWSISNTGVLTLDGTTLDINSLDFVGAGTFTSGAATNLTLTPGTTGDLVFSTDADTTATFSGSADGTANVILTAGDLTLTDGDLAVSAGDFNVTLDAGDGVTITKNAVPTVDIFTISNTGQGITTTDGVDSLALTYVQATNAAAVAGSALDISVTQSGDASDTIRGININNITGGSSTETALSIGSGWDTDLAFVDTSPTVTIGGGGTITFTDGTNTLFSIADAGTTGNATTTGNLAVSGGDITTGAATFNFVAGTTTLNLAGGSGSTGCTVDGSGNLTCTGAITGSASGAQGYWTRTDNILTATNANDILSLPSNDADSPVLNLASSAITANGTASLNQAVTVSSSAAGVTAYGYKLALTNNPSTNANTLYGEYISFTDAGSLANTVTGLYVDATTANASDTTYSGVFTGGNFGIGDTSPAALLTVGSGDLFQVDSSGNVTAVDLAVNGGDITGATTMNVFNTSTTINLADAAITGTIDIGGVSTNGTTTVNIATEGTSADVITIGNSNASSTVAITGGNDWSIAANGNFVTLGTLTAGSGAEVITLSTGKIDADAISLMTATNGVGTTSTASGLEVVSDKLSLLQGCTDAYILKWEEDTDTWDCAADATGGGAGSLQGAYDGTNTITTSDNRDIAFTLADTNLTNTTPDANDSDFTVTTASGSTSETKIILADGVGTVSPTELLLINNADTSGNTLANGITVSSAGSAITTGINLTDADLVNAISVDANTILGTTGDINFTNFDVTGSSGDVVTGGDVAVNGGDITGATTMNVFNTSTLINLADSAITGTIDIGGVTADGATTINVATHSTSADVITIGNSNASTTVAITGGDDWAMAATGVLTMSASAAATTAIVITDTDYTNALSIGDNIITGTTYSLVGTSATIDFSEFDVAAATGAITINDDGDAGNISIEGTVLDINSLDFVGAGTLTSAATTNLTFTPGTTGDLVFSTDADTTATFSGSAEGTANVILTAGDLTLTDGDLTLSGGEIAATSDDATGTNFNFTTGALTSGTGLAVATTGAVATAYTGDVINGSFTQTVTSGTPFNNTGNVLDISRALTINQAAGDTVTQSGALVSFTSTLAAGGAGGTLADSSNILALAQSCGGGFSCTGAVLGITNAGTGSAIAIGAMSASSATTSVASIDIGAITTTNITTSTGLKIGALSGTGTTGYGIDIAGITKTGTTATAINIGAMSGAATTNTGIAIGNLSAGTTSNGITIGTNSSATSKGITIGAMTGATTNTGIDIGNISTGTTSKGINIGTLAGINGGTVTGIAISTMSGAATTTSATSIDIGAITTTNITTSTGLKIGALSGTGTTGYGIDIAGITKTGTTATAINIGAMSGAATTNTGIAIGNLSAGTTSKGITIGTNSSVTATGLDIGALSGTTANIGVKVGAISGASGTGTGLDIGAFTNTGATQYGVNIGAFSGTHAAGGGTTAGINIGNISSAGTTSSNYGIQLGTMTGGTTANYQISTGILTSATTTTNAQINLGGVVTTGGTTNYGINVGALSGTGTTNYGINVAALTSVGTTNYGLNVGGATGAATTNYGVFVGAVTGASTNISLAFAKENAHTIKVLDSTTADTVGGALSITAGAAANSTSTARAGGAITLTAGAGAANSSATTGQTAGAGGALNINTGNGGNETGNAAVVLNGGAGGAITIDLGDGGSPSGLSTAGSTGNGGVGGAWSLTSGAGGAVTNVSNLVPTRNGGDSGSISLITATGGETSCSACSPNSAQTFIGGAAGNINLTGGTGGAAFMSSDAGGTQSYTGGDGATINITAGTGGAASTTSADTNVGGAGGALSFSAGAGGAATNGTDTGGAGGDVTINAGDAGNGDGNVDGGDVTIYGGNADGSGVDGDVILAYTGAAVQGNVGIGTSTTTIQATAGYAGLHVNGLVRIINPQGTTTAPTLANEGEHAFATVSAVERMYVWINGARRYFNRTGSADFSEFVIKQDVVSSIVPGDVVTYLDSSTPRAGIILATNNNGGRVMGVVSAGGTRYNDDEGEGLRGDDPNYANVGMLGHVPVKVNLGNGPIVPGDYLVPSSTAGVAMKSPNEAGVMIGFAMESYDGSDADGQIMMFVSPGFYDPNANTYFSKSGGEVLGSMKVVSSGTPMEINLTGSTDINAVRNIFEAKLNGEMKFQILETGDATLSGKLNAGSLKTIAQAEIGGDLELSGDFKVGGLVRLDRNGNLKNITSVQVVSSVNADGSITLGTIPSTSVGSSVSIAQTSADPISATRAALALSSAGTSASDYLIYSEPFQVTYDGRVKSKSLEVKESVLVGGDNVTSGNLISGKVGDSFSGLLVKFTNSSGKSLFSIDGSGLLVVDAVKTRAIVIDNTDQPRATIGSAVVPAQSLVITVTAPEVRPGMKIFITPKIAISQSLAVTNIEQGSFTVSLAHRSASDVPFDWWLVDVTNPSFTASSQVVDSGNGGNSNEQGNGGNSVLPTDNTQPTTNNTVEPVASNEPVVDSTQPVASGTPVAPTTVQPTASVEPTSTESQPVASTTTEPAPTTAPITVTDSTPVASVSTPSAPEPTPNSTSTTTTTTEPIVNNTPTVQASIVAE